MSWEPADDSAYAYLLGWYLGDGCVSRRARTYQLVITADRAYPRIIDECRAAIEVAIPGRRANPHTTPASALLADRIVLDPVA